MAHQAHEGKRDSRSLAQAKFYSSKWVAPLLLSISRGERVVETALLIRSTGSWGPTWAPASPSDGPRAV
eukprot:scaffold1284_cov402-Pavlova_lutheri.AAC.2